MSEQQHNINPWAEKLQQVSLPEPGEPKRRLFDLLDKEMPPPANEKKRWLLVLLFLLLLLGVCNCPGGLRGLKKQAVTNKQQIIHKEDAPATGNTIYPAAATTAEVDRNAQGSMVSGSDIPNRDISRSDIAEKEDRWVGNDKDMIAGRSKQNMESKRQAGNNNSQNELTAVIDTGIGTSPVIHGVDSTLNGIDSTTRAVNKPAAADSTPQKKKDSSAVASKKKTTSSNKKGWSASIGLNQSFPVGNRQWANPAIGDYIPVPQLQYRFNKKWSIQVELALHSPQYTPPLLLRQEKDSLGGIRRTLTLQKLYYLRVPVDIQYDFNDHWSAAGGINFGRLMDAIGLYETRVTSGSLPGSMASKTTQSLKKDTTGILYRQFSTGEWQWFATLNYRWKKLAVGIRYNQSWSNFINWPPVTGGPPAKGTNASLQLSVRYTLWQQKQKKKQ